MRGVIVTKPNHVELWNLEKPVPGPYQALVKTDICAVCNATDAKLVSGHFPGVESYPLVLGHESTGIVEAVGEKVRSFKPGDRLLSGMLFQFAEENLASGWGGFCDYTLANDHDAMVADGVADAEHGWFECHEVQNVLPPDLGADEAALLCTWREVMGGIDVFRISPNDRVLIYGGGPVGMSFVKFGRLLGWNRIELVDPLEWKREKALQLGADAVFDPADFETIEKQGKFDKIVDAVGSSAVINQAIRLIKPEGSICVYGVLGDKKLTLDVHAGPYNYNLMIHQWPTRSKERESLPQLVEWIRQGNLSATEFVTHRFPAEQTAEALATVKSGQVLKCLVDF